MPHCKGPNIPADDAAAVVGPPMSFPLVSERPGVGIAQLWEELPPLGLEADGKQVIVAVAPGTPVSNPKRTALIATPGPQDRVAVAIHEIALQLKVCAMGLDGMLYLGS